MRIWGFTLLIFAFGIGACGQENKENYSWASEDTHQSDDGHNQKRLKKIHQMYAEYKKDFPEIDEISVPDFLRYLREEKPRPLSDFVLVDTRTSKEQAVSMIPQAITKEEFERDFQKYRDKLVISYCTIGARSGQYTERLKTRGFQKAKNLVGSILSWTHAQGMLTRPSDGKETKKVHVYGKQWDLVASGYEAVY